MFRGRVTEIGNSPIQTGNTTSVTGTPQATNFKVVVTLEEEIPDVRPGFTCTAEITTATRKSVVVGADPGADRPGNAVRREGHAGPRAAAAAPEPLPVRPAC